jgi:hypothetical protein
MDGVRALPALLRAVPRRAGAPWAGDRGDIVLGWLTRLVVILGLSGIVLFDAISIGVTSVNVADQGSYAAREASETWQTTKDLQQTFLRASAVASEGDPANVVDPASFRVDKDNTVHLRISRTATTLVLYRIGPLEDLAEVGSQVSGRSVA